MATRLVGATTMPDGSVVEHRELVLAAIGERFFERESATEKRARAKQLINMLDMDGSFDDWCEDWDVPTHQLSQPPLMVDLPDGGPAFDVRAYIRSQPARTQWLVAQCPRAHSFTQQMLAGQASAHPDRTLKSYILQEAESV